jgi:hypothetical protein
MDDAPPCLTPSETTERLLDGDALELHAATTRCRIQFTHEAVPMDVFRAYRAAGTIWHLRAQWWALSDEGRRRLG